MNKLLLLLLSLTLALTLACCSEKYESPTGNPEDVTGVDYVEKEEEDKSFIGEDKVRLYIPADYIYSNVQSIADDAKAKGAYDVTVYDDGSVAYFMSREDYDKMMADNKAAFEKNIADLQQKYGGVYSGINYNEDFSYMDFYVNSQVYIASGDTMLRENLYAGSRMYQLYMGRNPEQIQMSFTIYDEATGEIVEADSYPECLKK